jgi:oleate hydratase
MEELLSQVPSAEDPAKTILESLKESNVNEALDEETGTRVLAEGKPGLEEMETRRLGVSLKDWMDLIMTMIEGEKILDNKSIEDLFGRDFFKTKFWTVFSVTSVNIQGEL